MTRLSLAIQAFAPGTVCYKVNWYAVLFHQRYHDLLFLFLAYKNQWKYLPIHANFPQWSRGKRLCCLLLPLLKSHEGKQITVRHKLDLWALFASVCWIRIQSSLCLKHHWVGSKVMTFQLCSKQWFERCLNNKIPQQHKCSECKTKENLKNIIKSKQKSNEIAHSVMIYLISLEVTTIHLIHLLLSLTAKTKMILILTLIFEHT